jgi:hypothetical protein
MSDSPATHDPLTRRIVEITTDEDETILIAFVPVGAQVVLMSTNRKAKGTLQ